VNALRSQKDIEKSQRRGTSIRRLSEIPDKDGKTRIIAIFDYWSQCSLKPLHESLNKILASIKEDCTFDQGKFRRLLNLPAGTVYHSIDLKSATDKMPVVLQTEILKVLSDEVFADAWRTCMVGYEFHSEVGPVVYAQGQPMGAYSS
jgi:hypothetical protein